jgi:hypothetical protein
MLVFISLFFFLSVVMPATPPLRDGRELEGQRRVEAREEGWRAHDLEDQWQPHEERQPREERQWHPREEDQWHPRESEGYWIWGELEEQWHKKERQWHELARLMLLHKLCAGIPVLDHIWGWFSHSEYLRFNLRDSSHCWL